MKAPARLVPETLGHENIELLRRIAAKDVEYTNCAGVPQSAGECDVCPAAAVGTDDTKSSVSVAPETGTTENNSSPAHMVFNSPPNHYFALRDGHPQVGREGAAVVKTRGSADRKLSQS